jgi:hypothetical protein
MAGGLIRAVSMVRLCVHPFKGKRDAEFALAAVQIADCQQAVVIANISPYSDALNLWRVG